MNEQNKKTVVVTSHRGRTITINGKLRRCWKHGGDWRTRLSFAEVRALGAEEPCPGRNYELVRGQYVRELGSDRYWPIPALPELAPNADIDDEVSFVDPILPPVSPAKPRVYAGRAPRGVSQRYAPLLRAARDMLPLLPADHPLARAMARLDEMRARETAMAEPASE